MKNKSIDALYVLVAIVVASIFFPNTGRAVPPHNPIVFVHGWAGSASSWDTMKQNFINAGWPSNLLFAISLSNTFSGEVGINITHAGEIRDYINNTVLPQTGANRVDIIAFSMGGLATMYYLHALNGATDGKVADVVCLDADVQGSTKWSMFLPDLDQATPVVMAVRTYDQTPGGVLSDPSGHLMSPVI